MKREPDPVEAEYEEAIALAAGRGDCDLAQELSAGLSQYRELYRTPPPWAEGGP